MNLSCRICTIVLTVARHEVEVDRRYEIVVTARDGLWRYRLGDIIEIAGFDSIHGSPILRYIERRRYAILSQPTSWALG